MAAEAAAAEAEWDAAMVTPVTYFGLDRIKIDDTVVSEIPSIQFNFNEQYVMEWAAEIEE